MPPDPPHHVQPRRRPIHPTSAAVRALVLWLIALALPFDGAAVGAQAVRGSLHVHRPAATAALRLVDFRRESIGATGQPPGARAHTGAQRHRHAYADASVVVIADDASDADHGAVTFLAALVALPTASSAWQGASPTAAAAWCARWTPSSGRRTRLERPPRLA